MSPTLTQVQRLEEEANALRLERDYANEEVGRGQADLLHLDEQLATAKEQLEAKSGYEGFSYVQVDTNPGNYQPTEQVLLLY